MLSILNGILLLGTLELRPPVHATFVATAITLPPITLIITSRYFIRYLPILSYLFCESCLLVWALLYHAVSYTVRGARAYLSICTASLHNPQKSVMCMVRATPRHVSSRPVTVSALPTAKIDLPHISTGAGAFYNIYVAQSGHVSTDVRCKLW